MHRVRAKLEWFKTVILPQEAALRGRLRRILPSTHELEDMVAEVLARAYATENWENVTTGRAYLFTIARNLVIDTAHSRFPVLDEDNADEVVGILFAKDLLKLLEEKSERFSLKDFLRPAFLIPESTHLDRLIKEFRFGACS